MKSDRYLPGIAFELMVADIQAKIDPKADVLHNQRLIDRLGQARQFDVVIRGNFAGQPVLGVIECKDLRGKVGTPEVDAFVTKAQDVNANFKILISRNGFSRTALQKCAHYGIQPLGLMGELGSQQFSIGNYWTADRTRFRDITLELLVAPEEVVPSFDIDDVTIGGKKILHSILNYLGAHVRTFEIGWTELVVDFSMPRLVSICENTECQCVGLRIRVEKVLEEFEMFVPMSGAGFYNWNAKTATFAPDQTITTGGVPTDLDLWPRRQSGQKRSGNFLTFHIEASGSLPKFEDALDLDSL